MPALSTEITEIVTAIGMSGYSSVEAVLSQRPAVFLNVSMAHWDRLSEAYFDRYHEQLFQQAWNNGRAFFEARDGLRSRTPVRIEWKGLHNPPGFDFLPADLRVDHVFLVSCKYMSKILANSSPSNLFERRLADRAGAGQDVGWYQHVAPSAYDAFYAAVVGHMAGIARLPARHADLTPHDIALIREACARHWPEDLLEPWREFSLAVATGSATRWALSLGMLAQREEMLWRMLRLNSSPYFVLGASSLGPLRMRIGTPWDWRQRYSLREMTVAPAFDAGQPKVRWRADVLDKASSEVLPIEGHVEVRWSHGVGGLTSW